MEKETVAGFGYKGNHIFRNQPNHSYFDKPFDDQDCLFQTLHELDPHFLTEEQKAESINFTNIILTDPRSKKPITKICFDHTNEEEKTAIFLSPKKSLMKVENHEVGVRVLNLIQQCQEVEEEDMYNWYRLQTLRLREKEIFQKFLFEYCENNKEIMYAPCRKLLDVYKKWYNRKSVRLIKHYAPETYNTYLGLPQVRLCKNVLTDQQVHITNPEIVITLGEQSNWQENLKNGFKELSHGLESYVNIFENSEELKESLESDLKQHFEKITVQIAPEGPCLYVPLESLLFLIAAGSYVDVPKEMLLDIKEVMHSDCEHRKYIVMDLPLPSRQGGWHTYEQVVEQAVLAMASVKQIKCLEKDIPETKATLRHTNDFKVYALEDFMENCKVKPDKLCKFSKSLIKWQLSTTEDEMNCFQIYTSLDNFEEGKPTALKLEYKPKFGCETLTKYKTLKEWFKLQLIGATESSCLRLDVTNFQTLLEEPLNTGKLEEILSTKYKLNCNELLNNLFEFLKMLYGMPLGHYMLRYNPKFEDKILLCRPSKEITQNTVHLHQLINDDVTDLEFISQQNFLPIDENLCSIMHLQHKILPAAFSPFAEVKKFNTSRFWPKQKPNLNHTKMQSKKIYKSKFPQNNTDHKKPMNRSRRKRANRRRRQYEVEKAKCNELNEMKEEMELDRLMLNNL